MNDFLKIVLVSTDFDPSRGKILSFYYLSKGLTRLGHEVKIYYSSKQKTREVFFSRERRFFSEGVPSIIFKIGRTPFSFSPELFKRLLKTDFDVIHVWEYATLNSIMAILVGFIKRKPCFVTTPLYLPIWNRKWRRIVLIICHLSTPLINIIISKLICESRAAYRTHITLGFPKTKVCVLPNSIDKEEFKPSPRDNSLSHEIGLKQSDKVVLIVSKLYETKGIGCLLKAWRILNESHRNLEAKLVILGDGNSYYENLVNKLGISNVVFLKKFIPHNEMPRLYSLADVFVLPSNYDQSPNVLLEAASCGVPIVATNLGGIVDIVVNGETGLLVNPESPEELAMALSNLLTNEELRSRMGLIAREFILRNREHLTVAKEVEEIYKETVH